MNELMALMAMAAMDRTIVLDIPRPRKFPKPLHPLPLPPGEATEEQKRMTLAGRRGKLPRSKRKKQR